MNERMEDVLLHFRMFFDNRMFSFSKIKTKQNTFFTKKGREMFHGAKDPNSSFKIFDPFFHNSPLLFIVEKFSAELKMTTNSQVACTTLKISTKSTSGVLCLLDIGCFFAIFSNCF